MDESSRQKSLEGLEDAFSDLGIQPLGSRMPVSNPDELTGRKRAFFRREDSPFAHLSLIRGPDGVLRWYDGAPGFAGGGMRQRGGRAAVPAGTIERQFVFEKLHKPSQVSEALDNLDAKLTDATRRELWQWTAADWQPFPPQKVGSIAGKNILLFIHGTFSHCDKIFEDLEATEEGRAFKQAMFARYDLVLAFNHPTLGASPAVNAFTLAAHLRDISGPPRHVDVICHSRGGLVTRWWLEGFADPRATYRAVFVASTLGGTSLVAPPMLKGAFDFLTNVASALGTGAGMSGVPFLQFVGGLMKILSSVARVAIHSPALDAAVAAIPGLAAQSRVGNNPELRAMRASGAWQEQTYFAVQSDFRPPANELWKFWKLFCDPGVYARAWADKAVDLVFVDSDQKHAPNDLVVDCASMIELADNTPPTAFRATHHFGQSSIVMHTNYFKQPETLAFIDRVLTPMPAEVSPPRP